MRKGNLVNHLSGTHNMSKPDASTQADTWQKTLNKHQTGFPCRQCRNPRSYKRKGDLVNHLFDTHNMSKSDASAQADTGWQTVEEHQTVFPCGQCKDSDTARNLRSYKRKVNLVNHLFNTHNMSESDASTQADTWQKTVKKKYFSCGFCVSLFYNIDEQLNHIAEHFRRFQHISGWNISKVIQGLILQPDVFLEWQQCFGAGDPRSQDFAWKGSVADNLQLRLELGVESANVLATAAISEAIRTEIPQHSDEASVTGGFKNSHKAPISLQTQILPPPGVDPNLATRDMCERVQAAKYTPVRSSPPQRGRQVENPESGVRRKKRRRIDSTISIEKSPQETRETNSEEQVLFEQNPDLHPAAADSTASKSWSAAENAKMDRLRGSGKPKTLYERYKAGFWKHIAAYLGIHWAIGQDDMAHEANAIPFAIAAADAEPREPGRVVRGDGTLRPTQVSEGRDITPFRSPSVDGCPHEPGTPGRLALTPINSKQSFSLYEEDDNQGEKDNNGEEEEDEEKDNRGEEEEDKEEDNEATDLSISHCSSSHSPIAAPWNNHQTEITILGDDDYPAKRAGIAPSTDSPLPKFINRCDNYGCNSFHSHFDCPLEKKCWGCRSKNHFTSDCPMTCTNCCSAGHTSKHCEDFEMDPYTGIASPRRSLKPGSSAYTILPAPSQSKIYQCDNYACRDLHSHWDCPLPAICWGCRSSEHFWSGCRERCGKCGAQRHISKYCDEFEMWGNGMSRPIRRPDNIATNTMKRKRDDMQETFPSQTHDKNGNKIYCTFWLRTGCCAFEATTRGCKLKHEIPPDEATQREIGINISAPWLRNDPVVQELEHKR
ncbi:hypothetical protein ABVK25_010156 [Lepraria finkii]|uniref:C2H2-type domain-containing protein n=1 Tax=Lepraria finkii TaxID=1340010 RepID=A0ABR4AXA3_9LECA